MINAPKMATTDSTPNEQAAMFINLQQYNLTPLCERFTDYFLVATIGDIEYYSPNDEDWGCIIAVDKKNKLAINTGFYETGDFEDSIFDGNVYESDYRIVCQDCKLVCKFQSE